MGIIARATLGTLLSELQSQLGGLENKRKEREIIERNAWYVQRGLLHHLMRAGLIEEDTVVRMPTPETIPGIGTTYLRFPYVILDKELLVGYVITEASIGPSKVLDEAPFTTVGSTTSFSAPLIPRETMIQFNISEDTYNKAARGNDVVLVCKSDKKENMYRIMRFNDLNTVNLKKIGDALLHKFNTGLDTDYDTPTILHRSVEGVGDIAKDLDTFYSYYIKCFYDFLGGEESGLPTPALKPDYDKLLPTNFEETEAILMQQIDSIMGTGFTPDNSIEERLSTVLGEDTEEPEEIEESMVRRETTGQALVTVFQPSETD